VKTTTTVLLLRHRYDITVIRRAGADRQLLAEDTTITAFQGSPANPEWIAPDAAEELLRGRPAGNLPPEQRSDFVRRIVGRADSIRPELERLATRRAEDLAAAHRRVRHATGSAGRVIVTAHLPVDVLGVYLYLPA
jgi:hypothetical protein